MALYEFFTSRNNGANAASFVGQAGRLFYDGANGVIKLSDGVTPGGTFIPYNIATTTTIGGFKAGPGANVSLDGTLTIDTSGLPLSIGNLQIEDTIIKTLNPNEDLYLVSNGTGNVNLIGTVNFYKPNGFPPDEEPFFRAKNDGQLRILVPAEDPIEGGVEIIGSASGQYIPPGSPGAMLHLTGNPGIPLRFYIDGNAEYASFVARRYNGNVAVPTQVLANQDILRINATAATTLGVGNVALGQIRISALEDQTPTAQGSSITFTVTPIGSSAANRVDVANVTVAEGITVTKARVLGNLTVNGNIVGGGSQLTNLPPPTVLSAVSSIPVIVDDQLAATTIGNMTLTPPAGTYLATFSSEYSDDVTSVTATAAADLAILYAELMALTPTVTNHAPAYGSGETLGPGVYTQAGASSIAGTLTLNGGPDDIFVFRCAGALTTANGATIVLTGGAVSNNVWWVAQGAITTGSDAVIRGTLLANQAAVSPGARAAIQGRLLAVNGAISIDRAVLTAATGVSVLNQGSLALFNIFAGIGPLTNAGASTIALSIGTNNGTITGFGTATITGETYVSGPPELAVIAYGIYVDGVLIAHSKRGQTQTRAQSGWPMTTQAIITVTEGQTVDVRTKVTLSSFSIGPAMSLVLLPVTT